MITLYLKTGDDFGEEFQLKLESLILAFKTELLPADDESTHIVDGGKKIEGKEQLLNWMHELEKELRFQRSVTGDACYIDPETGEVC